MSLKKINSALISVYHKQGLEPILQKLNAAQVTLYSTGGTQDYIQSLGYSVHPVESLTGYPSILDGRVKTLHPMVFGGILAQRNATHLSELTTYNIPQIDLVVVDLYPFEETVSQTDDEDKIIEKIDIGGISLIRAAAKNYKDVAIVASQDDYDTLDSFLAENKSVALTLAQRKELAKHAFDVSSHYDVAIYKHFSKDDAHPSLKQSHPSSTTLRYGENPHQEGVFHGSFEAMFEKLNGKAISYNNLVDIDAAVQLIREFWGGRPTFAILKHTNACGIARADKLFESWRYALAADPISAFGGIFVSNTSIDEATARDINKLFYEVLIAPGFSEEALTILKRKKNRILLVIKDINIPTRSFKSLLNGVIEQDTDLFTEHAEDVTVMTKRVPTAREMTDLLFAAKCAKHLKSNSIALVKDERLVSMGCGQPSRIDALRQAIFKAHSFGLELKGAVMASDAFFPFPDCVELAHTENITAVIHPGGSKNDQASIDYCDSVGQAMVTTGHRHFRH